MLSKSRGQVLRLAGVLHVLFSLGRDTYAESVGLGSEEDGSDGQNDITSDEAVKAAIDFCVKWPVSKQLILVAVGVLRMKF